MPDENIQTQIQELNNWTIRDDKLVKEFTYKNFMQTHAFVSKIALIAEKMNHHPTITYTYGKASISTYTHDTNTITQKDIDLCKQIDELEA